MDKFVIKRHCTVSRSAVTTVPTSPQPPPPDTTRTNMDGRISNNKGHKQSDKVKDGSKTEKGKKNQPPLRKFLPKWTIGRPWLTCSSNGLLMWCLWCKDHQEKIPKQYLLSRKMIDGSNSLKVETINIHERSQMHQHALTIQRNTVEKAEQAPAIKSSDMLDAKDAGRLALKFRNVHAVVTNKRPFRDYLWLCDLDEAKGLDVGATIRKSVKCTGP
jgi:hypothetical protein